jgi:methionyl-tRNA formyltransferase
MPALKALLEGPDQVTLVVTTTPARAGRGLNYKESEVAALAKEQHLTLLETSSINDPECFEIVEDENPDILIVAAFGGFLGQKYLNLGYIPPINIHPSLLPKHRGPAPVNWTIINGDALCGVSVLLMELKIDTGPIIAQTSFPTPAGLGAGELEKRLASLGAQLLMSSLERVENDSKLAIAQDETKATINRLMNKNDGYIDFKRPSLELANLVNGVDPWPGAQCLCGGKRLKLYGALSLEGQGDPGQILGLSDDDRLLMGAGTGLLAVSEVQPEGRSRLSAASFFNGCRVSTFENIL